MEKTEQTMPEPTIEKRGRKYFVYWGELKIGPWDWVGKLEFTRDHLSWEIRVKKGGRLYLLVDGVAAHGVQSPGAQEHSPLQSR